VNQPDVIVADPDQDSGGIYRFTVGGIGVRVCGAGLSLQRGARREAFETAADNHDIDLRVGFRELSAKSPGKLVFDSEMVWRLYDEGDTRVFRFTAPNCGEAPYKELRVRRDYAEGEIVLNEPWRGSELPDPLEYPLDELLVVHRLGRGLGCELHACGIVDHDGLGWLFVGHSGAGKSTLARLWADRDVSVLSDDRIILREIDGCIRMYGTPWHGEAGFAVATDAPLAGVLVIEHGQTNRIEDLDAISAVSELMARSFVPFHEAEALETAISVLSSAAECLPCCRFKFQPDDSAIDSLKKWMRMVVPGG
jgi:hypothetical protein